MDALREIARTSLEAGRIAGLETAIEAAKEFGHDALVPVLTVLRDWPRAGAFPRHSQDGHMHGHIKTLVRDKGFGFIRPMDGSTDVFFHYTACRRGNFETLKEGDQVEFDQEPGQKGPRATDVELV
jgi:CspA family cold shock protein